MSTADPYGDCLDRAYEAALPQLEAEAAKFEACANAKAAAYDAHWDSIKEFGGD